jgi:23S rRNA A2030 N6-methylase RlmJ
MKRYFFVPMLWLSLAGMVGITSLLTAHFHQTQASTTFASPTPQDFPQPNRPILDPDYPGSFAYLALRAQDRVQQTMLRPEELPVVFLMRSQQRLEAAQYAWEQGDPERALAAVHKAHVYLHRSLEHCQDYGMLCEAIRPQSQETSQEIITTVQMFHSETTNDEFKASLERLTHEVAALGLAQVGQ